MKISPVLASAILTLAMAITGTPSAAKATAQDNFRQIMATINNVEWTIQEIAYLSDVSHVRLVQLDGSLGSNQQAFDGALAAQQGTAQVDALRAAIAGNRRLVAELERQHIRYMNIVAVHIGRFRTITVYTFGASA
jgi:hypothetical protein